MSTTPPPNEFARPCPHCGELVPPLADTCTRCGAYLGGLTCSTQHPAAMAAAVSRLRAQHPWPIMRPMPRDDHGWFDDGSKGALHAALDPIPEGGRVVVELGAWLGLSTRWILDTFPDVHLITVDTWLGAADLFAQEDCRRRLPKLFEQFLSNCRDYQDRLTPLRADTITGLQLVAAAGVRPDVVWIDAGHEFQAARADLETALALFPMARICGHDWGWRSVRRAVEESHGDRKIGSNATSWWLD
jgi:hypothetical protein